MDSPDINTPPFSMMKKFRNVTSSNDSGYATFISSTAESSAINVDNSDLSLSHKFFSGINRNSTPHNNAASRREAYSNLSRNIASIRLDEDRSMHNELSESMDIDSPIPMSICNDSNNHFLQSNNDCDENDPNLLNIQRTPRKSGKKDRVKNNVLSKSRKSKKKRREHSYGTPDKKKVSPKKIKLKPRSKYYSGVEHIDIVKELLNQGLVVGHIFNYLSDMDLVNFCKVSPVWSYACSLYEKARTRKETFLEALNNDKENGGFEHSNVIKKLDEKAKTDVKRKPVEQLGIHNISNIMMEKKSIDISPPVSPNRRKHHKYVKAASISSSICQCIYCQNPASINGRWATCLGHSCGMVFCKKCSFDVENCDKRGCKFLMSKSPSPPKERTKSMIGKKSATFKRLRL